MIKYFWKSLKFSVQAKIEQPSHKLDSFKELIQKIVDIEAKTAL